MLEHVPMDKKMLRKWLDAGYIHNGTFHDTEAGTPQGGIISPVLANITLDGLEQVLADKIGTKESTKGRRAKVNLVRYADDFIISGSSKELLENKVKPVVREFLEERGLVLSEEKTKTAHISEGFDFLGQNLRKYGDKQKYLTKPSKKSVKSLLENIRDIIKRHKTVQAGILVGMLNPIIRGWVNYHRYVVSKKTFSNVDSAIWKTIWDWARRRHPKKSKKWVRAKYFTTVDQNTWTFFGELKDGKKVTLFRAASIPIKRHIKIRGKCNPYDPAWKEYLKRRSTNRCYSPYLILGAPRAFQKLEPCAGKLACTVLRGMSGGNPTHLPD